MSFEEDTAIPEELAPALEKVLAAGGAPGPQQPPSQADLYQSLLQKVGAQQTGAPQPTPAAPDAPPPPQAAPPQLEQGAPIQAPPMAPAPPDGSPISAPEPQLAAQLPPPVAAVAPVPVQAATPAPFKNDTADGNGKTVSSYVADVMKRVSAGMSITDAIHSQESGGKDSSPDSVDGAKGGWQITPATFDRYAKKGESIDNPKDNEAVGRRIIADLSEKTGGDPAKIAVGYFSGEGNIAKGGSPADTAVARGTPTAPAAPSSPFTNLFPSAESQFGPIKKTIDDYIAQQPQLGAQLASLRKDYAGATKPGGFDEVMSNFTNWAGLQNAASANKLASAGGVLLRANPDPVPFGNALKEMAATNATRRSQDLATAKETYDQGASDINAQRAQQTQNVGLKTGISKDMIDYGLQTGKLTIEGAKAGLDITKQFENALKTMVPNPETAAALRPIIFAATKDTPLDLAGNLQKAATIIQKAQAGTLPDLQGKQLQIAPKEQPNFENFLPPAGSANATTPQSFDVSTPQGRAKADELSKQGWTNVPKQTTNIYNAPGGIGQVTEDTYKQSIGSMQAAQDVSHRIDYLKDVAKTLSGGTGVISNSPISLGVKNALKDLGVDVGAGDISARELFNKELNAFANSQVLSTFKTGAAGQRLTKSEFDALSKGIVTNTMPLDTINAALGKYQYDADREVDRSSKIGSQAFDSMNTRQAFNPIEAMRKYETDNPYKPPALPADWGAAKPASLPAGAVSSWTDPKTGQSYGVDKDGNLIK